MKKVFISLLVFVVSIGTVSAWDYEQVLIGDLYYNLDTTNQLAEVTYMSVDDTSRYVNNADWDIATAIIPETIEYNSAHYSVISIGSAAFFNCPSLTSVTIGNNVTSIGEYAFDGCNNITSVTWNAETCNAWNFGSQVEHFVFGDQVEVIPANLCSSMDKLSSIIIPYSVTNIGDGAFDGCINVKSVVWKAKNSNAWNFGSQVENFIFGDDVEVIPASLCQGMAKLNSITIPEKVTSIGDGAFTNCNNIKSVVWNAKNSNAWNFGSQVESFSFGDAVETIPDNLCAGMDKPTTLVFPASLISIGDNAFEGWKGIKQMQIPNKVENVGANAFKNCIYITSIYLGYLVTEIGDSAFSGCIRVNDITSMNTTTPVVYDNTLSSISSLAYLFVPAGSKRTYQLDPYWSRFDIKEIGAEESTLIKDSVTVVANDDNAVITWPTNSAADAYTLQITKDGEVFCTLIFNSNGQLIGIAFAPSRDGISNAPAATLSVAGMSFTVTGLNSASKYSYSLAVVDDNDKELVCYHGEFATNGYEGDVNPGGEPEMPLDALKAEFEEYKTTAENACSNAAIAGDSQACLQLIADAQTAIATLVYDENKSLEENKAIVDAIVAQLSADLEAQRESEHSTTAIDFVIDNSSSVTDKFIKNGQLFIRQGDKTFNAQGARVE